MSQIYHRDTKTIENAPEYQAGLLHFLYETALGRVMLHLMVARPWFSKLRGIYQNSRLSRRDIAPFIEKYGVSVENPQQFASFNEFFIRKKEVTAESDDSSVLMAVADSKLRYYPITDDLKLSLKHSVYDLTDILEDAELAERFRGGTCIVFRLTVDDYHRYHFVDDGKLIFQKQIPGLLHTVRPISEKYKVYTRNARSVSLLSTDHFGEVVQIEVGALLVGKIVNHPCTTFRKLEEKGYFEFGGSTVVLLLNKPVQFDDDIVRMNASEIETKVRAGERIGILC